ncbi:MAG: hypothetical protein CSA39_05350 [Flavobacteriales bacterium]|nr:MAG: hypothetical protein CSA39_05350 [Flavobacteriales bacterium]
MKKFLLFVIGICVVISLTGCFEVVEEVSFNADGSGTINITANLSQSKSKINATLLLDSVNNQKVPTKDEIKNYFSDMVSRIKKMPGIKKINSSINIEEYIFTLSCDFDNVETLNSVIAHFSSKRDVEMIKKYKHFAFDKANKTFKRSYHYNLTDAVSKTEIEDRKLFDAATITTIYRFPTEIVSSTNSAAKISKNKKAIMLRLTAADVLKNNQSIKNTIKIN